jgi:hypothetical protein
MTRRPAKGAVAIHSYGLNRIGKDDLIAIPLGQQHGARRQLAQRANDHLDEIMQAFQYHNFWLPPRQVRGNKPAVDRIRRLAVQHRDASNVPRAYTSASQRWRVAEAGHVLRVQIHPA